jgi:hypothetical protein
MPSKFMRLTKQPDYRLSKRIRAVPRSRRFLNVLNSLTLSAGSRTLTDAESTST